MSGGLYFKEGAGYVLVDQHPLIGAKIDSQARRISPSETGIVSLYPAARAFLLSGADTFKWTKAEQGAFAADSYAVNSATYRYFWSPKGTSIAESEFVINNQSATEIPLDVPGSPTYLSINNKAQVLTKNDEDKLLIKLMPNSYQNVLVQYKVEDDGAGTGAIKSVFSSLPKPPATVSNYVVNLTLPQDDYILWFRVGDKSHWWTNWFEVMKAFILVGLLLVAFRYLQFKLSTRVSLSLTAGLIALFVKPLFALVIFVFVLATVYAYRKKFVLFGATRTWRDYLRYGIYAVIIVAFYLANTMLNYYLAEENYLAQISQNAVSNYTDRSASVLSSTPSPSSFKATTAYTDRIDRESLGSALSAATGAVAGVANVSVMDDAEPENGLYQGVPVRIQVPQVGHTLGLKGHLVMTNDTIDFRAWVISNWLLNLLIAAIAMVWCFVLYRHREIITKFLVGEDRLPHS